MDGRAEILDWRTGLVIPGTEEIELGPGLRMVGWETGSHHLRYADFSGRDLSHANLSYDWLDNARFIGANLSDAMLSVSVLRGTNLQNAVLDRAFLNSAQLTNANLEGASIRGASLTLTTSRGFTKEQLYSTASYQSKSLENIQFGFDCFPCNVEANDLTGWDFSNQMLHGANFSNVRLTNTTFDNASVAQASLRNVTSRGFTSSQLYSTGSYQRSNLASMDFSQNDLAHWDFSNQDLSGTRFYDSNLAGADLAGAIIVGADFTATTVRGFTAAQLASTFSYQQEDLSGIRLAQNNLSGWDFSRINLSDATLTGSNLTNTKWIASRLVGVDARRSNFAGSDLKDADLRNANFGRAFETAQLAGALFGPGTVYNQWTVFPEDFDPTARGLTFALSPAGDFDANDTFDSEDQDRLSQAIRRGLNEPMFELTGDGLLNGDDLVWWIHRVRQTLIGDANWDGKFDSADLVQVFQAGAYEDNQPLNADWAMGDWNADGDFTSSDLVVAFNDGGYQAGFLGKPVPIPEPRGLVLPMMMTALCRQRRSSVRGRWF